MTINAYSKLGLQLIDAERKRQGLPTLAEERREEVIQNRMKDFGLTRKEAEDWKF